MSLTYGLRSARDLLEKLKRDLALLDEEVTSDRFFNFVLTGYSLIDWVNHDPAANPAARAAATAMHQDKWIKVCGDLANSSKHVILTRRNPITADAASRQGGFGQGRFGKGGWGVGEEEIVIELKDKTSINCLAFAAQVVQIWEAFFKSHGP
jgi:hypothetical protein